MDLDDFLGSVLASVSHARRMADEESAAIAEYYKDNDLLSGMSVPRLRLPEVCFDIPVTVESFEPKSLPVMQSTRVIVGGLLGDIRQMAKLQKVELSATFLKDYQSQINDKVTKLRSNVSRGSFPTREMLAYSAETLFVNLTKKYQLKLTTDVQEAFQLQLRESARERIFKSLGTPPKLQVDVVSTKIKDKAPPGSIMNIKLRVTEEGLEWNTMQNADGSTRSNLTPE